jgi:hypothetical protein
MLWISVTALVPDVFQLGGLELKLVMHMNAGIYACAFNIRF